MRCTNVDKVICCTESAELGRHWRRECKKWTEKGMVFLECWYTCSYCMFYSMWSVHDCVHDLCVNVCTAKSIASKPFLFRNPVWGKQTCSVKLQIVHNYCEEIVGLTRVPRTLEHLLLSLEQGFLPIWGIVCAWVDCLHFLVFVTSVSTWSIARILFRMRYMLLHLHWCVTIGVLETTRFLHWFYFCPSQKASDSATERE